MRVLVGATLIDGTGRAPVADAAVLIDGERIAAAGPRRAVAWPSDAEVVDVAGLTLLPGLIDTHDHLASHGYSLAGRWGLEEPATTRHLRTAAAIRGALEMGYTTVRDAGGLDDGFRQAIEQGLIPGPRLSLSLQIVSPTGGIGDRIAPSGHTCCVVADPTLPPNIANGPEQTRDVVRAMIRAGADVIKCATTGGASSRRGHGPRDPAFSPDEMRALVGEAHGHGRRVMCHALGGRGLRMAIEAGVDSIEHGCYLNEEPELLRLMAERGIVFTPTLTVYENHRKSPSPHVRARARDLEAAHVASIQQALALGVPISAGTDAGGHGHPANAAELQHLVAAGLTPMQAIQAGTAWAASAIGWEREVGTLEPGKLADLVAVQGDPLQEITVLQQRDRIALVVKGGATAVARRDA